MNYNRADTRSCCGAKQEPASRGVVWCGVPSGRDATKLRTGNWIRRRRRRRRLGYGVCAAATPDVKITKYRSVGAGAWRVAINY